MGKLSELTKGYVAMDRSTLDRFDGDVAMMLRDDIDIFAEKNPNLVRESRFTGQFVLIPRIQQYGQHPKTTFVSYFSIFGEKRDGWPAKFEDYSDLDSIDERVLALDAMQKGAVVIATPLNEVYSRDFDKLPEEGEKEPVNFAYRLFVTKKPLKKVDHNRIDI